MKTRNRVLVAILSLMVATLACEKVTPTPSFNNDQESTATYQVIYVLTATLTPDPPTPIIETAEVTREVTVVVVATKLVYVPVTVTPTPTPTPTSTP